MRKSTSLKTSLLVFFVLLACNQMKMYALTAGDIAIISVNTDAIKTMTFVALTDIPANTSLSFTDKAWNASISSWRTGEGTIVWNNDALTTKGSIVALTINANPYLTNLGSVTTNTNFDLSASGDQILAYSGTTAPTTNDDAAWLFGFSTENWAFGDNTNTSDIPTALSAVSVSMKTSTSETDNAYFANASIAQTAVTVSGTKYELLALFCNRDLYYMNDTGPLTVPTYNITVMDVVVNKPTITITEVTVPILVATVGNIVTETVNVSAINLTDNLTISIIDDANNQFDEPSVTSITILEDNTASGTVKVTYRPTEAGNHTATLKIESVGAATVTRTLSGMATIATLIPNIMITEVYGGGGNSGAVYQNDFVELYNNTASSIDISSWSVQYYSSTGTSVNSTIIPSGSSIAGKGYFLVAGASAGPIGDLLPTPDVSGSIDLSGSKGKVVLYSVDTNQTLSNSTDLGLIIGNSAFVDYVTYGSATPVWGSALGALSNTLSASRISVDGVYAYSKNIGADFEVVTPTPRNKGFTTTIVKKNMFPITANDGTIKFTAGAGELVEVYDVMGRKIKSKSTIDGMNVIPISYHGVFLVRLGNRISKVTL